MRSTFFIIYFIRILMKLMEKNNFSSENRKCLILICNINFKIYLERNIYKEKNAQFANQNDWKISKFRKILS